MGYVIAGIIVGIIVGGFTPLAIPLELGRYTAVGILAILDSLIGGIRASVTGEHHTRIFLTGLLFNILLAGIITYLGDQLGLDLYLGVVVVFTLRLFRNFATIRHEMLDERIRGRGRGRSKSDRVIER